MGDPISDIINAINGYGASQAQQQGINNAQNNWAQQLNNSSDMQQAMWSRSYAAQKPWLQGGQQSLAQLMQGLGSGAFSTNAQMTSPMGMVGVPMSTNVNPQNITNNPAYQFQLQQGQQALQRAAAANGSFGGGAFMKGLDQFSQGLASQAYQQQWQNAFQQNQANFGNQLQANQSAFGQQLAANNSNFANQFQANQANYGNLAGIAGMGLNAAQNLGQLDQNYANARTNINLQGAAAMGSLDVGRGNQQAAGIQNNANAMSGLFNDTANLAQFFGGGGFGGGGGSGYGGPAGSSQPYYGQAQGLNYGGPYQFPSGGYSGY